MSPCHHSVALPARHRQYRPHRGEPTPRGPVGGRVRAWFAPPGLVELAGSFGLGESLLTGKVATVPLLAATGARITPEGSLSGRREASSRWMPYLRPSPAIRVKLHTASAWSSSVRVRRGELRIDALAGAAEVDVVAVRIEHEQRQPGVEDELLEQAPEA